MSSRDDAVAARADLVRRLQVNIPEAMRALSQWLLWRYETDDRRPKPLKVPYYVDGRKRHGSLGGAEDRAALVSFEAALDRLASAPHFTGLGFAFLEGDGLVGVDLDGMFDLDTGAIREEHMAILEACASYSERSVSGKGAHIILAGQVDSFKHDPAGIEVYCAGRYFTCTGDRLADTPAQVQPLKPYALAYMRELVQASKDAAKAARVAAQPDATAAAERAPKRPVPGAGQGGDDFRRMNDAALQCLPAWVPQVFTGASVWRNGYRVTSKALGRDLEEDLQLVPEGIMDFGEEQGLSPIDVLIKWHPATPTPKDALHWLAPLVGVQLPALQKTRLQVVKSTGKRESAAQVEGDPAPATPGPRNSRPRPSPVATRPAPGAADHEASTVRYTGQGDLPQACDATIVAALKAGMPLYQRGNALVFVTDGAERAKADRYLRRDPATPRIVSHDDMSLADQLTRVVCFQKKNRKSGDFTPCDCLPVVARTILARRDWPTVPELTALVNHPVMLPDGRVLDRPGYDRPSGLLLTQSEVGELGDLSQSTREDCDEALLTLRHLFSGFPFESEQDESVALALALTMFVAPALSTKPIFAANARAAGSGKSSLVTAATMVATGCRPAFMVLPRDHNEVGKVIFSALMEGDEHIAIDNQEDAVSHPILAAVTTASVFRGRVLGRSETMSVPTSSVISINGNNLSICGDGTRRTLICTLDPLCDRPAERTFAFDPITELRDQRHRYVRAALLILATYHRLGARVPLRPFGSFEDWSRLVREPLVWLGMPDPVDSIRTLEDLDPEREALRVMLQSVHSAFGDREFRVAELLALAKRVERQGEHRQAQIAGAEPDSTVDEAAGEALTTALRAVCAQRNGDLSAAALGRWLGRMNGRYEGGQRFLRCKQLKDFATWKVSK